MNATPELIAKCPPESADDLPAKVFRLLFSAELIDADFQSWEEEGRPLPTDPVKACRYKGLSVFTTIEDARHHIRLYGDKTHIAEADLTEKDGVGEKTKTKNFPSHMTWWPADDIDRKASFKCV
jgi:hypothetical protein